MLSSETSPINYVGDGPQFSGESPADAWAANTAHHLAGHLLRPGGSIEHEPTDAAEKASARTAKAAGEAASDMQGDESAKPYTLSHVAASDSVRRSVRGAL